MPTEPRQKLVIARAERNDGPWVNPLCVLGGTTIACQRHRKAILVSPSADSDLPLQGRSFLQGRLRPHCLILSLVGSWFAF